MTDYRNVAEALAVGAEPAMLCATCPWDRHCITPPTMSKADVDAEIEKSKRADEELAEKRKAEGKDAGAGMGVLMTALMFSGKDTSAQVCPVYSSRLRSSSGRALADGMKQQMLAWDDNEVAA